MRGIRRVIGFLVILAAVCSFVPASFGQVTSSKTMVGSWVSDPLLGLFDPNKNKKKNPPSPTSTMPEGGSTWMYLGLAGLTCVGAAVAVGYRKKYAAQSTQS